jgi:hypothetical protein
MGAEAERLNSRAEGTRWKFGHPARNPCIHQSFSSNAGLGAHSNGADSDRLL